MTAILFYTFALLTAASALCVVFSRDIVRTALSLMFTLSSVAGLYFLLRAEFVAAVQLVVYAGGTLILIIFGVMLTTKSPFARFNPSRREVAAASLIAATLLGALVASFLTLPKGREVVEETAAYPVAALGAALLGDYLIPFEIASVLLLVVMIGAAYVAKVTRPAGGK